MNHTFTTKTWGGNKPASTAMIVLCVIVGLFFLITIIGAPIGILLFFMLFADLVLNMRMTCPSCNAKISVNKNAKAFSCYNCQAVFAKKNNQWEIVA